MSCVSARELFRKPNSFSLQKCLNTCFLNQSKNVLQILVMGQFDFLFDSMLAIQECFFVLGISGFLKCGLISLLIDRVILGCGQYKQPGEGWAPSG